MALHPSFKCWWQHCLPQHLLSRLAGRLTNSQSVWLKNFLIRSAMKRFNISLEEAEITDAESFKTFNEFFTRTLKASARPIDTNDKVIISPSDGIISQIGRIAQGELIQAKGKTYSLENLLGINTADLNVYKDGYFATIYLSPRDYHRVHMPLAGNLIRTELIPGRLFSVNLTTASGINKLFTRNERVNFHFKTEFGPVALSMVGAMLVASIETPWHGIITPGRSKELNTFNPPEQLHKGDLLGQFRFGSTVILVLPPKLKPTQIFEENHFIKMGQPLFECCLD